MSLLLKYKATPTTVTEDFIGPHWPTDAQSIPYVNTNLVTATNAAAGGRARSNHRLLSAAASVNATSVSAVQSTLYNIEGMNAAAAVRYLKLYNKATAPTVGTDTPVATFHLPASSVFKIPLPPGLIFTLGIGYGFTVLIADADTTALTAADILALNITYA